MIATRLEETDISELESLLIRDGKIEAAPYSELNRFSQNELSLFCHKHGVYQLPTNELIDFIRKEIGERGSIEIGSGNGCIGRSLGIRMTDNKMQDLPHIKRYYEAMRQPTIRYGEDVEHLDAIGAVKKYRPEVVIGCWVTHLFKEGMETGNAMGIEEEMLFELGVKKYIHIGNELTHRHKPILAIYDCKRIQNEWLLSRSASRENNIIYIITKRD